MNAKYDAFWLSFTLEQFRAWERIEDEERDGVIDATVADANLAARPEGGITAIASGECGDAARDRLLVHIMVAADAEIEKTREFGI